MHSVSDEINIVDRRVVESPEMLGKECIGCLRILAYGFFSRDASYRDGHKDLCVSCENTPRMSTEENTARLRESNFNSEAVKAQRWEHQEEYKNDEARIGRALRHSDFLILVKNLVPNIYITEGNIQGDLAVFRTYPGPQSRLEGRDFEYLFYCPTGILPEFSQYEFDTVKDIPIREKRRGWRTVLLRLIKSGLLKEEVCNKVFGIPNGPASSVWFRQLKNYRQQSV